MSRITRVNIPEVEAAAGDLDKIAADLEKALDELKALGERLHGCWGEDEFGEKFAENYLPLAEELLDQSDHTVTDLATVAMNLREIARHFQDIDQEAGEYLELSDPA